MRVRIPYLLIAGLLAITILTCGQKDEPAEQSGQPALLPEQLGSSGFERSSEIRTFVGESLYEYINGGAELYHQYKFVEVITADYKQNQTEIVADIYKFDNTDCAYGLLSSLRPFEPQTVGLGVAGYASGTTIDFVKGNYLVRLVVYDDSPETFSAMMSAAEAIEKHIPGKTTLPDMFAMFPSEGRIAGTETFVVESFLGQMPLTDIYAIDYEIGSDTVKLFLSDDPSGEKYSQWSERANMHKMSKDIVGNYPFESAFVAEDSYYGNIIAGLHSGKLCGIIGFGEQHEAFLIDWLNTIQ
jgi:hypothetical protein